MVAGGGDQEGRTCRIPGPRPAQPVSQAARIGQGNPSRIPPNGAWSGSSRA